MLGLALSGLLAILAFRRGALTASGAAGAVLVGTMVFGFGGWIAGLALIAFFASSSFLSRIGAGAKAGAAATQAKSSRRDLGQVLANGGVAALAAAGMASTTPGTAAEGILAAALIGALATANADTWATELGMLAGATPRLITTGRPVAAGVSGGVTVAGLAASLAGAAFIGVTAAALGWLGAQLVAPPPVWHNARLALIAVLAGAVGATCDSILGATVQAGYRCDTCQAATERTLHSCGSRTRQVRGIRWLDNDWVNLLATGGGSVLAAGLGTLWLA
jgi:uncharacterized protein (TIGR00297 family)